MLNIAKIFSIFKYLYINVGFLFFKHRDTETRSNIFKFFEDTEKKLGLYGREFGWYGWEFGLKAQKRIAQGNALGFNVIAF